MKGNSRRDRLGIWKLHIIFEDLRKGHIPTFTLEWCRAEEHLIYENPECPPIDSTRVAIAIDDFRCDILFGANE